MTDEPINPVQPMKPSQGNLAESLPRVGERAPEPAVPVPQFRFVIPDSVRKEGDPKVVVLKELTEAEYDAAERVAPDKERQFVFECVKTSLVAYGNTWDAKRKVCPDLVQVNHGDAEAEILWGRWSLKVKFQIVEGWKRVNQTTQAEDQDFLASMSAI